MSKRPSRPVVGWREMPALPDWKIPRILAKIDTGARTSAIHVEHIQNLNDDLLRFDVVVHERPSRRLVQVEAEPVRWARVKPSSGERQVRPVVLTTVRLGDWEQEIEVSLIRRRGMLCRMLLGRTALDGLLVDVTQRYQMTSPPKKKRRSP